MVDRRLATVIATCDLKYVGVRHRSRLRLRTRFIMTERNGIYIKTIFTEATSATT